MRVIAGTAKGRKLQAVPGETTRPTTDRVKESLFGIIGESIEDSEFLDLFAGTGAIGIEALSRGAKKSYLIESAKDAHQTVLANLEQCKLDQQAEVRHTDAFSYLKNTSKSFDFIYIDPPQFKNLWIEVLQMISERPQLLKQDASVIVKIHPKEFEEFQSNFIELKRQKKYGNSLLLFYLTCRLKCQNHLS